MATPVSFEQIGYIGAAASVIGTIIAMVKISKVKCERTEKHIADVQSSLKQEINEVKQESTKDIDELKKKFFHYTEKIDNRILETQEKYTQLKIEITKINGKVDQMLTTMGNIENKVDQFVQSGNLWDSNARKSKQVYMDRLDSLESIIKKQNEQADLFYNRLLTAKGI